MAWAWQDFEQLYPYFQSLIVRSLALIQEESLNEAQARLTAQEEFMKNPDDKCFESYREAQPTREVRQLELKKKKDALVVAKKRYKQHHSVAELFRGAEGI